MKKIDLFSVHSKTFKIDYFWSLNYINFFSNPVCHTYYQHYLVYEMNKSTRSDTDREGNTNKKFGLNVHVYDMPTVALMVKSLF